jgi:tryptophan synthase alpha chain
VNRIEHRFEKLRNEGRKGLVVYIGAGDPDLATTEALALALDQAGVDVLELGIPFSDPLADGLVNQLAAQRGLASGTTPAGVLETVSRIRSQSEIPIVLYLYYNLIHRVGLEAFVQSAAMSGVDGLLVLDLPPEESDTYGTVMEAFGLCPIWLIAPTTPLERMSRITRQARGFIYYVSREGVTGMQDQVSDTILPMVRQIRSTTHLPIAIGFGISNPHQACSVAASGEAVVVGSAVVNRIARLGGSPEMIAEVTSFVRSLRDALDGLAVPPASSNR